LSSRIVERRRLLAALDDPSATLTLVSAPAGAGKTTLLLSWLADRDGDLPIAWIAAREGEDGGAFWQAAADAIAAALTLDRLEQEGETALDAILRTFVQFDSPLALVVDDFHEVASPLVVEPLSRIAEWAPDRLHIVLACRRDPALPLHRLRLGGRLNEIRSSDLGFTLDESAALFRAAGIDLDEGSVAALHARTDGWAAALRFAAISLRDRADTQSFVLALTRTEHAVADYLVREVLEAQTPELRDFLLRTSLCEQIDGALADAVTGGRDGARTLDVLERDNVFVELQPDGRWYRYHRLFGELLRSRADSVLGADVRTVHAAAADWLAREGFRLEALRHTLAAGDANRAAELAGGLWPDLVGRRELDLARSLLARAPVETVLAEPRLCVLAAWERLETGDTAEADAWLSAADDHSGASGRGFRIGRAIMALRRARLVGDVEALERALTQLTQPEALAESPRDGGGRRALVLAGRATAALWSGDVALARATFEAAAETSRHAGLGRLEADSTASLALACALGGELRRASRLVDPGGDFAAGLTALAICHLEWGDAEEAKRLCSRAVEAADRAGDEAGAVTANAVSALAAIGSPDGIEEARRRLAAIDTSLWLPLLAPVLTLVRCRIALTEADPLTACGIAADAGDSPQRSIAAARIALATRDVQGARSELDAILGGPDETPLPLRVEAAVLRSLAELHEAADAGCEWIEHALGLAEAEAIRRPFTDCGPGVAELLRRTIRRGSSHRWLAGSILSVLDGRESSAGHAARELLDPLSERELIVLRYLPTMMSNQEIAGELFVSVNTVKTHLKSIYRKLGASDRRDAVKLARELRLVG
jgi:LuxR family maltose regulon positive regulatory protein